MRRFKRTQASVQSRDLQLPFNQPQYDAYSLLAPRQTIVLPWGRGVGKSWFIRQVWWLLVSQWDGFERPGTGGRLRGIRIVVPMPTLVQFKDVHAELLEGELAGDWAFLRGSIDRQRWDITFPGGSSIRPYPCTDHTSRRARGIRCDVVTPDEIDDIDIAVWNSVAVPWFSEPWSLRLRVGGGTPRRGRYGLLHSLHALGKDPTHLRYHSVFATWRDAPENVDPDAVADAKATTPPAVFQREWECNFDSAEGLVYDLFSERFHVRLPDPRIHFTQILVGVDFGYTNPGAYVVIGIQGHGEDAIAWILDEVYQTEKVESWWIEEAKKLKAAYPTAHWFADPSQPARIDALQQSARVQIRGADNSLNEGVSCVADKLMIRGEQDKWARLYVSPTCPNTIREFRAYRRKRDPHDAERYLEDILKKNDHAMDAIRYPLFEYFGLPPSVRVEWQGASSIAV